MKVTCTSCQTGYKVADEKVPAAGARAKCPNCGQTIIVPGPGRKDQGDSALLGRSGVDYGQTMAYDFSEVDQSRTEISAFLEKVSEREPFFGEGLTFSLRDIQTGEEHPVADAQVTVGRSGADIDIDDPEVSRKHCQVKVFGDQVVVLDLRSTNGTRVHGKKVMTASIVAGEQFTVGNTTLELVIRRAG